MEMSTLISILSSPVLSTKNSYTDTKAVDAILTDSKGNQVFRKNNVEAPAGWSQKAINIAASKYLKEKEFSIPDMIREIVDEIGNYGKQHSYFQSDNEMLVFKAELTHLLWEQEAAFNSPVWFNVRAGVHNPQVSACFINHVEDSINGILNLANIEARLFKKGSGSGTNYSSLRSSKEPLSGGGTSSGPVSFMKVLDSLAGVVKSAGVTRRAARLGALNIDHPDIIEFVRCKADEEAKAKTLIENGHDPDFSTGVYKNLAFQNTNHSVVVPDKFFHFVTTKNKWNLKSVLTGDTLEHVDAATLLRTIAQAAWECGDPGLLFIDTINKFNTCSNSGQIQSTNPCVTGDTLITMSDGAQIRIDNLVGNNTNYIVTKNASRYETRVVGASFYTGDKQVYEIKTKSGITLNATEDHLIMLKSGEYKKVKDLSCDDDIQIIDANKSDINTNGVTNDNLDITFYQIIGAYLGDGSGSEVDTRPTFILSVGNNNKSIVDKFYRWFVEKGNFTGFYRWFVEKGNFTGKVRQTKSNTYVLASSKKEITDIFKKYIDFTQTSLNKSFTDAVMKLSNSEKKYVLQGLFSVDGTVANYSNKSQYVGLDSSSLHLLEQVQQMLLSFGIKSKIYYDRRKGRTTYELPDGKGGSKEYPVAKAHSLRISRYSRKLFEELIGFMDESYKNDKLTETNRSFNAYKEEFLDRVVSVTKKGIEKVYDLCVPLTNNFIANGIVVHNCGEFAFLDDTACNLASINLMKFYDEATDSFDFKKFSQAVSIMIIAQDILVGMAGYPTLAISRNSINFRPLGLGYANLGALLMMRCIPYDSPDARRFAARITAEMTCVAYETSQLLASRLGSFEEFGKNVQSMCAVMKQHAKVCEEARFDALSTRFTLLSAPPMYMRNSQVTVIAPTGTIGFMMDCVTTGIEPELALVKYKKMVGGGYIKIVNPLVKKVVNKIIHNEEAAAYINDFVRDNSGLPPTAPKNVERGEYAHLCNVLMCSLPSPTTGESLSPMAHVNMVAAVQPFLSGSVSKTVNLPKTATVEDIENLFIEAHELGLKGITVYRDGCKGSQPLNTKKQEDPKEKPVIVDNKRLSIEERRRMPEERASITHKFRIGEHSGYITAGMFSDGSLGEIFITMSKEGTTLSGMIDAFATTVSMALQYGVPIEALIRKFKNGAYEPSGYTNNKDIKYAKSITDYVFRWLELKFVKDKQDTAVKAAPDVAEEQSIKEQETTGQFCPNCGGALVKSGSCSVCADCGTTTGCS